MLKRYTSVVCQRLILQRKRLKPYIYSKKKKKTQYFIDTMNTYQKPIYTPCSFNTLTLPFWQRGVNVGPGSDRWNAQESYYLSLGDIFVQKGRLSCQGTRCLHPSFAFLLKHRGKAQKSTREIKRWARAVERAPKVSREKQSTSPRQLAQDFLFRATGQFLTVEAIIVGF